MDAKVGKAQPSLRSVRDEVVIVGGGAGGIAVATSMLAQGKNLYIAIVEPADVHYYQPG